MLNFQEKIIPELCSLYEQYGYKKYKMSKFEEYDLYLKNKNFLKSQNIITFNDLNGRLLALKPDVTLSIVKNSGDEAQKLFYTENVYRIKSGQYKEIMQTGLEYIGDVDIYTICEVIALASKSLACISDDYILDISHMGFITGLLDECNLTDEQYSEILSLISSKVTHEIQGMCSKAGIPDELSEKLIAAASLYGSAEKILPECKKLVVNEKTQAAYEELLSIYNVLKSVGCEDKINIDFSLINDMSYYNGIIFQGFIKGISDNVISGGRYDNLMAKFGKKSNAIGFAVYTDLLEYFQTDEDEFDVDIALCYDDNSDPAALMKAINMFIANGQTVLAFKEVPKNLKYKQILRFNERGIEIVEEND